MEIDYNPITYDELRLNQRYYFMKYLSTVKLDHDELELLRIVSQTITEKEYITHYTNNRRSLPAMIDIDEKDRITPSDREHEWIRIKGDEPDSILILMTENLVYVTYLRNKWSKKKIRLNLEALAIMLAPYGVEYSTNKFAKVTLRLRGGPSHLFFSSGAMLETGSYSATIARKSLNQTLVLLKTVCKFDNIEIGERRCENIVAKGTLKFELCLLLLKDSYPSYVQYNTSNTAGAFVGAIIRLRKINTHQKKSRVTKTPKEKVAQKEEEMVIDGSTEPTDEDSDDDDDSEDEEEEEEEEDEAGDDNFSDYEFLEVTDNNEICNSGFDYYSVPENIAKDLMDDEEELNILNMMCCTSTGGYPKKKKRRKANILTMVDPNDIDGYEPDEEVKVKNITIIVFEKGRIICAGCKNERSVYINCDRVRDMLLTCKKTPKNIAKEKELRKTRYIQ